MVDAASPVAEHRADLASAELTDQSTTPKWKVWTNPGSVSLGGAEHVDGLIVLSVSPGEWIVLGGDPPTAAVDLTHVRAMFRLSGPQAREVLAHVCAIDLGDTMTPNGAAARTLVAGVATELVRDDVAGTTSYLLLISRSFARSVWDRLVDVARRV